LAIKLLKIKEIQEKVELKKLELKHKENLKVLSGLQTQE
jgi:hypothetical protein